MQDLNKLQKALKEIVEVANSALMSKESEKFDDQGNRITSSVSCTIKSLSDRLLKKADETATRINPLNAAADGLKLELAVDIKRYWGASPRVLTVSFMERTSVELRRKIVEHMNAWTKTACISFVETGNIGHVRISRGGGGYWSYLGTDILHIPKSRPTMNLEGFTIDTPESEFVRVVRHETGHTLGFPHEHMRRELVNRIDPEKAYQYFLRTQGWNRGTVDQQVLTPLDDKISLIKTSIVL